MSNYKKPLKIKFTPKQIAQFETIRVPGMNNSEGNRYKKNGVQAQQHQIQEAKKKEEKILSRMEMRPTLKRQATISEKLKGKKDEYKQTPQIVGMSGTDPIGEFIISGIGLNGVGALAKTGLWNIAKYAPKTWLGDYGRQYFIGNAFKNSFNGNVLKPVINPQIITHTDHYGLVQEPGLTSLKFFERAPSKISKAEKAGIPKMERNFKPKQHIANYPGYQLKGLMKGSQLEKQLSKNGTININQLNAYFNKASQTEREIVNKVLAEKFSGQKTINYNQFKKAIQNELIGKYNRIPQTAYADYGVESLGYNLKSIGENELPGLPNQITLGQPIHYTSPGTKADPISLNTFTFESPRIPYGNTKHYSGNPIGHSRTYTLPQDPHTLYVMESQSDWAQQALRKKGSIDAQSAYERASQSAMKHQQELEQIKANLEKGLAPDGHKIQYEWERRDIEEIIKNTEKQLSSNNARAARFDAILHPEKYIQENHLKQNYLQRQLQENLRYAAENKYTKMRYPTSETAAKIEGYTRQSPSWEQIKILEKKYNRPEGYVDIVNRENFDITQFSEEIALGLSKRFKMFEEWENSQQAKDFWREFNSIGDYYPEHQTILKKYSDFPKLFQKLFKDQQVRTVTDIKGNTWYEVDVPKGYLNKEWQFKQGGKINVIEQFKNGRQVRKAQTKSPIHYSRTMTADNLSKAANYVGKYILKGLDTFGKIMTAPLTGGPQGPATVVLPKTKKQLDADRKIREIQEQQIGKASTWLSPLNYGTALVTGNGLNAKKGEEEVASWSPAWQAVGRIAELYVGPKIVKKFVPKRTKGLSNNLEQYALRNSTRNNSKITKSDVQKSLVEAEKYKGSKGYIELVHKAQKEAEEMGLPFDSNLYIGVNKNLPNIKLDSRPKGKLGGYRRSTNTIELDPDQLNEIEGKYVPFHEGLHWQNIGKPEMNSPLYNRWKKDMKNDQAWHEFYQSDEYKNLVYEDNAKAYAKKKVKEALYEDADSYLSIPGELQANGLEAGRAIGLEPFAEYPGYTKAIEAIEKARNYNGWLNDVKAGTTQEIQNFWKILTGNYLPTVSMPLTTGYTLYNTFNQPQYQKINK